MLMSVDLRNGKGEEFSFTTIGWALYLNLAAVMYGWEKLGTLPPREWLGSNEPWEGAYDWNAGQVVAQSDASALADALEMYLADPDGRANVLEVAAEIGRIVGIEITVDEIDRSTIEAFVTFARSGEFEIW